MKKLISLVLTLALVAGMLPVMALAEDIYEDSDLGADIYYDDNGTVDDDDMADDIADADGTVDDDDDDNIHTDEDPVDFVPFSVWEVVTGTNFNGGPQGPAWPFTAGAPAGPGIDTETADGNSFMRFSASGAGGDRNASRTITTTAGSSLKIEYDFRFPGNPGGAANTHAITFRGGDGGSGTAELSVYHMAGGAFGLHNGPGSQS
jgi:hypothetical protein